MHRADAEKARRGLICSGILQSQAFMRQLGFCLKQHTLSKDKMRRFAMLITKFSLRRFLVRGLDATIRASLSFSVRVLSVWWAAISFPCHGWEDRILATLLAN